jgi:hypothetical protein
VNTFLTDLAVRRRVAAPAQHQALGVLLSLHGKVLGRPLGDLRGVSRARRPKRVPVILARDEVAAVLARLEGVPLPVSILLYGAGLR